MDHRLDHKAHVSLPGVKNVQWIVYLKVAAQSMLTHF